MLIVSVRVERNALCSVLLLRCLQLREDLAVSADLLTLKLLSVSHIGEKLTDPIELPAESVDIVTEIRRVIIMGLILDGLDDSADLANASMEVLELSVDLTLHDLQVRDDDADPHH